MKLCACGCGEQLVPDARGRMRARYCVGHWVRSQEHRDHLSRVAKRMHGPNHPRWRGRIPRGDGYVRVWAPGHPMANSDGYALEHRWMLHEMAVPIPPGHHVHHINGNKADNRWSNLEVLPAAEHRELHLRADGYRVTNQFGTWPVRGRQ